MPLTALTVTGLEALSLEPLRGMPLTKLDLSGCDVDDPSPLQGMPLRELRLSVRKKSIPLDISVIRGMPLEVVYLRGTRANAKAMRVLLDCPQLRVIPNTNGFSYPAEWKGFIDYLKHHPRIESICAMSAQEWWRKYDAEPRHARGFRERADRWARARTASELIDRRNWQLPGEIIDGDTKTVAKIAGNLDWDLGKSRTLSGVAYLPPLSGTRDGAIGRFKLFGSKDGVEWKLITDDNFLDVEKADAEMFLPFPEPVSARHIRLTPIYCYSSETGRFSATEGVIAELQLYTPKPE